MPLQKGLNHVNHGLNYIHYCIFPFLPLYCKFVYTAIDIKLENDIHIVIEYGCYLTKIAILNYLKILLIIENQEKTE